MRSERAAAQADRAKAAAATVTERLFEVGDQILVTQGPALTQIAKWPPFQPMYFEGCIVTQARHTRYALRSQHYKVIRKMVHARRLRKYCMRPTALRQVWHEREMKQDEALELHHRLETSFPTLKEVCGMSLNFERSCAMQGRERGEGVTPQRMLPIHPGYFYVLFTTVCIYSSRWVHI